MPHGLKVLVAIVAVPTLAAVSSWELGVYLCNYALIGRPDFDLVCGHNAPIQLLPSFLFFFVTFFPIASRIVRRRTPRASWL